MTCFTTSHSCLLGHACVYLYTYLHLQDNVSSSYEFMYNRLWPRSAMQSLLKGLYHHSSAPQPISVLPYKTPTDRRNSMWAGVSLFIYIFCVVTSQLLSSILGSRKRKIKHAQGGPSRYLEPPSFFSPSHHHTHTSFGEALSSDPHLCVRASHLAKSRQPKVAKNHPRHEDTGKGCRRQQLAGLRKCDPLLHSVHYGRLHHTLFLRQGRRREKKKKKTWASAYLVRLWSLSTSYGVH